MTLTTMLLWQGYVNEMPNNCYETLVYIYIYQQKVFFLALVNGVILIHLLASFQRV